MWYGQRVARDVSRWQAAGWISDTGAAAIRADLASRKPPFGAAAILAMLGAVLFGFAIMSFVAANWNAMSKLARLTLLLATLWACYGGAAWLFKRQLPMFAQAAVLGGIAVYGASIMLISQMYHMEGSPPDAVLLWALGALLAAVLVPSGAALAATFVLIVVWTCWERSLTNAAHFGFLVMWAAAAAAPLWMRWRPGLHLAALALIIWLVPIGFFVLDRHAHWLVALIGVPAGRGAPWRAGQEIDRHVPASAAIFAYAIVIAYAALFIMQFIDSRWFYSGAPAGSLGRLVLLAAICIVGLLGAMLWALKTDNTAALWLGLRRLRHRGLQPACHDDRHAAQHVAVLPGVGADRQRLRLCRLPPAPAQGSGIGGCRMIPWLKNRIVLTLVIVALAQTAVLAGMVADRVRLLKTGREITLPIVPVDPRDFFRGEYVRLGYDISSVPARLLEGPLPDANAAFYVTLERKPDGTWVPSKLSRTLAEESSPDRIVLKARAMSGRLHRGPEQPQRRALRAVRHRELLRAARAKVRGSRRSPATRSSPPASPSTGAATPPSRAC